MALACFALFVSSPRAEPPRRARHINVVTGRAPERRSASPAERPAYVTSQASVSPCERSLPRERWLSPPRDPECRRKIDLPIRVGPPRHAKRDQTESWRAPHGAISLRLRTRAFLPACAGLWVSGENARSMIMSLVNSRSSADPRDGKSRNRLQSPESREIRRRTPISGDARLSFAHRASRSLATCEIDSRGRGSETL